MADDLVFFLNDTHFYASEFQKQPLLPELDIDKVLQHFQDYKHNKLNQSDLKSKVQSILKSNNDLIQYFTWKKGQEGRAQQVGNFDPDLEREFSSIPNVQCDELLDMNFI